MFEPVLPLHRLPRHRRRAASPKQSRTMPLAALARNQNHLLAALPTAEFERLAPHLELVAMPLGEILYEPGGQLQHAYFPTTAIVSLHYVTESGASAETAGVGNEGMRRHFAVHGRRHHAELGRRADRRPRLPAGARLAEAGIQSRRPDAALAAALHPGADHADEPDRRLQSAPFDRAAAVPLAVVDPRSHCRRTSW